MGMHEQEEAILTTNYKKQTNKFTFAGHLSLPTVPETILCP